MSITKRFVIEVEATATFIRTYAVEAEDEWAALEAYQNDAKKVEWVSDSNERIFECTEHGMTACVYTDDNTKTLLIVAADAL
jgi:hypothetical protein